MRSRKARIGVRRVGCEGLAAGLANCDEFGFAKFEQRPRQRQLPERGEFVHASEAADPRAAKQTKDHRLGLVVGMMGGDEKIRTDFLCAGAEQLIARLARALLNATARL